MALLTKHLGTIRLRLAVLVTALALFVTACDGAAATPTPRSADAPTASPAAQARTIALRAADTGTTVSAAPGDRMVLMLASNPTTGYRWALAEELQGNVVRLVGSAYRLIGTPMPGAGGEETWTFEAVGAGEARISLKYARSFEPNQPPVATFQITVAVR